MLRMVENKRDRCTCSSNGILEGLVVQPLLVNIRHAASSHSRFGLQIFSK